MGFSYLGCASRGLPAFCANVSKHLSGRSCECDADTGFGVIFWLLVAANFLIGVLWYCWLDLLPLFDVFDGLPFVFGVLSSDELEFDEFAPGEDVVDTTFTADWPEFSNDLRGLIFELSFNGIEFNELLLVLLLLLLLLLLFEPFNFSSSSWRLL